MLRFAAFKLMLAAMLYWEFVHLEENQRITYPSEFKGSSSLPVLWFIAIFRLPFTVKLSKGGFSQPANFHLNQA